MYAVDVDLVVRFVPPMLDIGSGIRLTRSFELPFVPQEDIAVFSKDWEGMEDPLGYRLKEITELVGGPAGTKIDADLEMLVGVPGRP